MRPKKCQRPAPWRLGPPPQQILYPDINDRGRDQRLGVASREADHVQRRQHQCERMPERKTRDDRHARAEPRTHHQQPKQKQQVVITRPDVLDAHLEKRSENGRPRFGGRSRQSRHRESGGGGEAQASEGNHKVSDAVSVSESCHAQAEKRGPFVPKTFWPSPVRAPLLRAPCASPCV